MTMSGFGFMSIGSDMAEDDSLNADEEWLQLRIGCRPYHQDQVTSFKSNELELMPSSRSEFRPPEFSIAASRDRPGSSFPEAAGVIQPPRRPHSGIWFSLQPSPNQDGKMTIRLVIKYLIKKLSLENESEIEIRCRGERVEGLLTLQHVIDNIWSRHTDFITLLPNSSTTPYIMLLHYATTNHH